MAAYVRDARNKNTKCCRRKFRSIAAGIRALNVGSRKQAGFRALRTKFVAAFSARPGKSKRLKEGPSVDPCSFAINPSSASPRQRFPRQRDSVDIVAARDFRLWVMEIRNGTFVQGGGREPASDRGFSSAVEGNLDLDAMQ